MSNTKFIFDLANNHSGNVEHGIKIIQDLYEVTKNYSYEFVIKFQYRQLNSFIHPDFKDRLDIKYVKRFLDTELSEKDFTTLKQKAEELGFKTACTPFDNESVAFIEKHNFDYIKIASCSINDWSLLESVVSLNKPFIISTAGESLDNIDKTVFFFNNRNKDFCLMHCIAEYPTVNDNLQLNQIDILKERYSKINDKISIGLSTHELPTELDSIKISYAKGVRIFERHVDTKSIDHVMNSYSSTPDDIFYWIESYKDAEKRCGSVQDRNYFSENELNSLFNLKRGVFAKHDLSKGSSISNDDIFLAIPVQSNQLISDNISKFTEYTLLHDIKKNERIMINNVSISDTREIVSEITEKLKEIILKSHIKIQDQAPLQLSHHYGIEKFEKTGVAIIDCINREYCKKLLILFPGQHHPIHSHKRKEETFQVLYGSMSVELNNINYNLKEGDMLTVERDSPHSFSSDNGCVFEEISTTHYINDSFYGDFFIMNNFNNRKTNLILSSSWLYKK